jgi:hypothetical protein
MIQITSVRTIGVLLYSVFVCCLILVSALQLATRCFSVATVLYDQLIMKYVEEIVVSCCKLNSFNLYRGSEEKKYKSNSKSPACIPNIKQLCEPPNRGAVYEVGLKTVTATFVIWTQSKKIISYFSVNI